MTGFLVRLWSYCLEYQLDGNVDGRPADVLEEFAAPCMERATDPLPTVREALEQVGFVNRNGRIHDWYDYAGAIVQRRRNDRHRKRLERRSQKGSRPKAVRKLSGGQVEDRRGKSAPRVEQSRVDKSVHVDVEFLQAWGSYPKRAGTNSKAAALRQWQARVTEGATAAELFAGTERYAKFCRVTEKWGTEYVMQAQRFYGRDRHWEETWAANGNGRAPVEPTPPTTKTVAESDGNRLRLAVVPLDDPRPAV